MTNQQGAPEALHLATASNAMADEGEMIHLLSWHEIRNLLRANVAELHRQHARIAELEAQLEAIGAETAKLRGQRMVLSSLLGECLPVIDALMQMPGEDSDARMNGLAGRITGALNALAEDQVKGGEL